MSITDLRCLSVFILGRERFCDLELARRRKAVELLNPKLADGASEEVETILDREIELRIFRPENQINKAGIMYFHGGGFVMCHVKMYRKFLTNLGTYYTHHIHTTLIPSVIA